MKTLAPIALVLAALAFVPLARADDPSLHEVYQAVHDGRLNDAQTMMTQVLRDHPNSAKAHYVEAEVLARMSRAGDAQQELNQAEHLAPGLPFAKPEAVRDLRGLIAERGAAHPMVVERPAETHAQDASSFPWGIVLVVVGVGLLVFLILRNRGAMAPGGVGVVTPAPGVGPYGAPYGTPYGAPMGGGMGSGIVGGLATGAAIGAGMVAGEALAHEFIGNHDRPADAGITPAAPVAPAYDDGGRDFGVSDAGSWDSGSSLDIGGGGDGGGGGGDWG